VGAPAEFFDHVARCSDCHTKLVASEDDARAGRRAVTRDPYRAAGARREEALERPARGLNARVQGTAIVLFGLLLGAVSYLAGSR
jgi:hypothetical protein